MLGTSDAGSHGGRAVKTQATAEVVDARVYSGIHFRIADEHGAKIGKQVARWREKHFFEPARSGRHDHGHDDWGDHDHDR